ncbi:hypothetical protein KCV07_g9989, partial [Aureobasidium melanogenum]
MMSGNSFVKEDPAIVLHDSANNLTSNPEDNAMEKHRKEASATGKQHKGDNADARDLDEIILLSRYVDSKQHPFAKLNELYQKTILQSLVYRDLGYQDQYWAAQIGFSSKVLDIDLVWSDGRGGSKQDAKRRAAQCALERLIQRLPHDPDVQRQASPSSLHHAALVKKEIRRLPENILGKGVEDHTRTVWYNPLFTKKQNQAFSVAQKHLELVRQLSARVRIEPDLNTILLALDLEWHETGKHELLEVGLSVAVELQYSKANPQISTYHLIVQEHYDIRNGTHVPDHKDDFNFGSSELIAYKNLRHRIREILESFGSGSRKIVMIGHSIRHDLAMFEQIGMGDIIDHSAANVWDIAFAYQAQQGDVQITKLSKILDHYAIPHENLHNAANDAYYTLVACYQIAMTEQQKRHEDMQIESRTPDSPQS